jgi:hypothetical protein
VPGGGRLRRNLPGCDAGLLPSGPSSRMLVLGSVGSAPEPRPAAPNNEGLSRALPSSEAVKHVTVSRHPPQPGARQNSLICAATIGMH